MIATEKVAAHPVAATTGGLTGIAAAIFWVTNDKLGWDIPAWLAVTLAGGLGTVIAAIGTVGVAGMWRRLLHGRGG